MYKYKDIATGKIKKTRGTFAGWTDRTGLLGARYAIFSNRRGEVLVPVYCLTKETRAQLPAPPTDEQEAPIETTQN